MTERESLARRYVPGLVSIVVPVYNVEEYLKDCLASIARQTYHNYEVICVDDGSKDRSTDLLARAADADQRLTVVHQANQGVGNARDTGIRHARGEWLAFVDSDDMIAPDALERMVESARQADADIVCFAGRTIPTEGQPSIPTGIYPSRIPAQQPFNRHDVPDTLFIIGYPAVFFRLFRHELVDRLGLGFDGLRYAEDLVFSMTAMAAADRIVTVDLPLYFYRRGRQGSLTTHSNYSALPAVDAYAVLWDNLQQLGLADELRLGFQNVVVTSLGYEFGKTRTRASRLELCRRLADGGLASIGMAEVDPSELASSAIRKHWSVIAEQMAQTQIMDAALVTIIMPVHNRAQYVDQAVSSVRGQSHRNLQIILVDDGSTDDAPSILAAHAAVDPRITVLTQPATGAGAARNNGLAIACGEYCMFLDSDDWFEPDLVQELLGQALDEDSDVAVCEARAWSEVDRRHLWSYTLKVPSSVTSRPFSADDIPLDIFSFTGTAVWTKLYRVEFLRDHGLVYQNLPNSNDVFFSLMALALAERISVVAQPLVSYRTRTGTSLQDTKGARKATHWLTALHAVAQGLQDRGRWPALKDAFYEQLIIHSEFNMRTVPDRESARRVWQAIRGPNLQRFGVRVDRPGLLRSAVLRRFVAMLRTQDSDAIYDWFQQGRPVKQ